MKVREANINDAESIANIHVRTWLKAYDGIMSKEFLGSLSIHEKTRMWFKSLSQGSPGINLVIENKSGIIGFCVFGPARDKDLKNCNAGELVALNIKPDYWGKGYGSEAISYIVKESKVKNWDFIYLWVLKQNIRAISFYESHGFIKEGTEKFDKNLTGHKLHEIRYIRALA